MNDIIIIIIISSSSNNNNNNSIVITIITIHCSLLPLDKLTERNTKPMILLPPLMLCIPNGIILLGVNCPDGNGDSHNINRPIVLIFCVARAVRLDIILVSRCKATRHATVDYCTSLPCVERFLQRVSIACYAERCISYDRFCPTV